MGRKPAGAGRRAQGPTTEEAALAELETAVTSVQQLHDATAGLRCILCSSSHRH